MTAKMEWVTGVLETTEISENSHEKNRAFSHEKVAESRKDEAHLHQCTQHKQQTGGTGSRRTAAKLLYSCLHRNMVRQLIQLESCNGWL